MLLCFSSWFTSACVFDGKPRTIFSGRVTWEKRRTNGVLPFSSPTNQSPKGKFPFLWSTVESRLFGKPPKWVASRLLRRNPQNELGKEMRQTCSWRLKRAQHGEEASKVATGTAWQRGRRRGDLFAPLGKWSISVYSPSGDGGCTSGSMRCGSLGCWCRCC